MFKYNVGILDGFEAVFTIPVSVASLGQHADATL